MAFEVKRLWNRGEALFIAPSTFDHGTSGTTSGTMGVYGLICSVWQKKNNAHVISKIPIAFSVISLNFCGSSGRMAE